ncbi:aldehyde dehydrogenase family protein [Geodermatophilus dictyosporus]|uniref:aldehyde dehydrogenase family protein n=1 Tax=Geodermatophilus dictyosporus TaxID=1523247 RepID=UPI00244EC387|nr:aldehyde dehydrogenase family protein [Geodermatophilus dictyosporus]
MEPATGDVIAPVGRATPEDVQRAIERAAEAQRAWRPRRSSSAPACCAGPGRCWRTTPRRSGAGRPASPARSSPSATSGCTRPRRSATKPPRCPATPTASCCAPAPHG